MTELQILQYFYEIFSIFYNYECSFCWYPKCTVHAQGGALPVIDGVITPISRVITTVTHLFSAIYKGSNNSIYNDRLGAHLACVLPMFKLFPQKKNKWQSSNKFSSGHVLQTSPPPDTTFAFVGTRHGGGELRWNHVWKRKKMRGTWHLSG